MFLRLSWRLSEQTNTRGSTASQTAWCGIVCSGCSRAGESFLKRRTEVRSSTERPQNKYLPSCLQRPGPFLSSPDEQREDGPSFGSEERKWRGSQIQRSNLIGYQDNSLLKAAHGIIVPSCSQSHTHTWSLENLRDSPTGLYRFFFFFFNLQSLTSFTNVIPLTTSPVLLCSSTPAHNLYSLYAFLVRSNTNQQISRSLQCSH